MTSMSCGLEPAIWPHDTGQQIPYFDRCHLIIIITWMSDIKENQFMGSLQFPYMGMGLRLAAFGRRSSAIKEQIEKLSDNPEEVDLE